MTLTQIREKLISVFEELDSKKEELLDEYAGKYAKNFLALGMSRSVSGGILWPMYCHKCGSFEPDFWKIASSRSVNGCPKCKESSVIPTKRAKSYNGTKNNCFWGVYEINDEYAILFSVYGRLYISQKPSATEEESLAGAEVFFDPKERSLQQPFVLVSMIQFDKTNPWMLRYHLGKYSLSKYNIQMEGFCVDDKNFEHLLLEVNKRVSGTTKSNISQNIAIMFQNNSDEKEAKTSSKANPAEIRKADFMKEILSFEPENNSTVFSDISTLFSNSFFPAAMRASSEAGYATYVSRCPHCNNIVSVKLADNKSNDFKNLDITCSDCGKTRKYIIEETPYYHFFNKKYFYWSWQKDINCVLLQVFFGESRTKRNSKNEPEVEVTFYEKERAFFGEKDTGYTSNYAALINAQKGAYLASSKTAKDFFCRLELDNGNSVNSNDVVILNTEAELKDIISCSHLRYSGLLEAWGFSSDESLKLEEPGTFTSKSYLHSWNTKGFLELLLKSGLTNIVKQIIQDKKTSSCVARPRAKNVKDVLGITKPVFKMAQELNPKIEDLNMLQKLWETDQQITVDDYNKIKSFGKESVVIDIKRDFDIPFSKQLAYAKDCWDYQCIREPEAIQLWYDYLRIAKKAGYNLKKKNIKYPDSLRKEHDICSFVSSSIDDGFDKELFLKKSKENSRYNYSLKSMGLIAVAPSDPKEIIDEGMSLHHCVSSYVNVIIEGRSIVMFIRKEEEPNEPFYTAEILIHGGKPTVTQVKGNMNEDPDPSTTDGKKVLDFVKKWASFKDMNLSF